MLIQCISTSLICFCKFYAIRLPFDLVFLSTIDYICFWTMFFFFFGLARWSKYANALTSFISVVNIYARPLGDLIPHCWSTCLEKYPKILGELIWCDGKGPTKNLENHPGSEAYLIKFTKDTFCFKDPQGSLTPPVFLRNGLYCEHEDVPNERVDSNWCEGSLAIRTPFNFYRLLVTSNDRG